MAKFFSLKLSKNIEKTPQGYLICRNVPICRSGYQEYYGRELVKFAGFDPAWGLDPDTKHRVFRPKEEVLDPECIASFEAATVCDEHPENPVTTDTEHEVNCGHVQGVHRGEDIEDEDGISQVTLEADAVVIKDPALVEEVYPEHDPESGKRDISCGYSLRLSRQADGTIVMTKIRGNHVAVVEKGRAGELVAIKDSAPPEINKEGKRPMKNVWDLILGRGLKATVADATPEELAELGKRLAQDSDGESEAEKKAKEEKKAAEDKAAKDAKQAKDAVEDPHRFAAHACLDRCMDACGASDKMGKDAYGQPVHFDALQKELGNFFSQEAGEKEHANDGEKELEELKEEKADEKAKDGESEEAKAEREKKEKDAKDAAEAAEKAAKDAELEGDEKGKSDLKQAHDSVRDLLKAQRPIMATIVGKPKAQRTAQESIALDSYNKAVKDLNSGKNVYAVLAKVKVPEGIATDAAAQKTEDVSRFFNGVPYSEGMKRYQEHVSKKGEK